MAQKGLWDIATGEWWKTEELCPEKTGACSVNTKPCTRKTFLNGRVWKVHTEEEREEMNKEAKEEESGSGKREVEGERETVETNSKRICKDHLDNPDFGGKVFEAFCPVSEVESVGNSLISFVCLLRLLLCLW